MKNAILLLAILMVILIQSVSAEELTGTWRYKGEGGVIVDYVFASEGKGAMVATTNSGEIFEYQIKYALKDIDGKQYLYTFVEIPDEKIRGVEVSEITFLSKDKIQTQEINTYVIEKKTYRLKDIKSRTGRAAENFRES